MRQFREVFDRRVTDEFGEALGQHRAGNPRLTRERLKRPRARGFAVKGCERSADRLIAQAREPIRFVGRQCFEIAPHYMKELSSLRRLSTLSPPMRDRFDSASANFT